MKPYNTDSLMKLIKYLKTKGEIVLIEDISITEGIFQVCFFKELKKRNPELYEELLLLDFRLVDFLCIIYNPANKIGISNYLTALSPCILHSQIDLSNKYLSESDEILILNDALSNVDISIFEVWKKN